MAEEEDDKFLPSGSARVVPVETDDEGNTASAVSNGPTNIMADTMGGADFLSKPFTQVSGNVKK